MAGLLVPNPIYKPFSYPWAYEAWLLQQQLHWLPEEVPMNDDIKDWQTVLNDKEKHLLTHIFRFFTQSDIEVNNCYMSHYLRVFQPIEIKMMLTSFSNMETIHTAAYAHLLDTLSMPETLYSEFLEYKEMKDKWDYMQGFHVNTPKDIALTLAVFGAFTEGLQLFASFAILLNFPRLNKMKGMGQIIAWSVRDETLHTLSIIRLFHAFVKEHPFIMTDEFKEEIRQNCKVIVEHEDAFIDLAFSSGNIEGLTPDEIKQYIRYIADRRLEQLNLKTIYNIQKNPLPWIDAMLNGLEHTNFFENRSTEYTKAATQGSWEDAFESKLSA